ncbi:MAG TPA: hypothetical protein VKE70_15990 [Candidatus Solibacter sp.]|nr:hypothetical protein [Candidatus Solibacter sp.]
MRISQKTAALAAMGALLLVQVAGAQEKKVKDQAEYDLFNQTLKDANNPAQQIKDLDQWTQKYPDSDYKDDRLDYYIQAYNANKQPAKVLEVGSQLMARDLKSVFKDPKQGPGQVLRILYLMSVNILSLPNASPDQIAAGEKAARALGDYANEYFTAANKPANTSDADWAKTKNDVSNLSKTVIMNLVSRPGNEALAKYRADKNPKNCEPAEAAFTNAMKQFPDSAALAYGLGQAQVCLYKIQPEKISAGLYEMARAVALDPTLGGTAPDPKAIEKYLNSVYTQYHGPDDAGLAELKSLAKNSPFPPAGFKIKSESEIITENEEKLKQSNPQLAMWLNVKKSLNDSGEAYFNEQMKEHQLPKLKGTIVEAKPACRAKELVVALSDATHPEVTLRMVNAEGTAAALTGKPETGIEIQWEGVPTAFSKEPFNVTMDADGKKIENLKMSPCGAAPVKKYTPKKK